MNGNFCKFFCKNVKKCYFLCFFIKILPFLFVYEKSWLNFSCVFVGLNLSCIFLWWGFRDFLEIL